MKLRKTRILIPAVAAAILATGVVQAAIINVATTDDLETVINDAGTNPGDVLLLEAGTHTYANQLTISKSVTIRGQGPSTILDHSYVPSGGELMILFNADGIVMEDMRIEVGNGESNRGDGYLFDINNINCTIQNCEIFGDYGRSIALVDATGFTFDNNIVTGRWYRQGIREGSEDVTITNNVFDCSFFQYGPIGFDQGGRNTSGVISGNYFLDRRGIFNDSMVPQDGGFDPVNAQWSVLIAQDGIGSSNLVIEKNTFVYQDAATTNAASDYATDVGVLIAPGALSPGTVTVRDNIFYGYATDEPDPANPATFLLSGAGFTGAGNALQLDGTGGGQFTADANFDIGSAGTVSFWTILNNTGKRNQFMEGPGNAGIEFQYRSNSGGQLYSRVTDQPSDNYIIQSGGQGTAIGSAWTCVQFTWDLSVPTANLYVDGTEVSYLAGFGPANVTSTTAVDTTTGIITIGTDPGDSSRAVDGQIDDMAFFDAVLNTTDLDAVRTGGAASYAGSNLVAHWAFDETAGATTAADETANNFDISFVLTPTVNALDEDLGVDVTNNLFFGNDVDANQLDSANITGADPLFEGSDSDPTVFYSLLPGSPALGAASTSGNIGANQAVPDSTDPTSSVTIANDYQVGANISIDFTASDADSGVASTELYVSTPGSGSFSATGLTETGTSGTFNYTAASGNGVYLFQSIATDNASNVQDLDSEPFDQIVVSLTENSAVPIEFSSAFSSWTFPMEPGLVVEVSFTGVGTPGDVTVSRSEGALAPAGYNANGLIGQSWTITTEVGFTFTGATVVFHYDPLLIPSIAEGDIDIVVKDTSGTVTEISGGDVVVDTVSNTITVSNITSFSDFYAGNNSAVVESWMMLEE